MKSKNLLLKEEVFRILEMMNIESKKTSLLTESIIDDIAQGVVRLGIKSGDDVATTLSKIEREFGVPAGVLDADDIRKLTSGTGDDVITKIVKNMDPDQITKFANKIWGQLANAHTATKNVVDNLATSGQKYTSENLRRYLNDMSESIISSPVRELDPLVTALRKEFVDRSYDSLKGSGIIDDIAGSTGKIGDTTDDLSKVLDNLENKIGPISDTADATTLMNQVTKIMDEFKIKTPSGIATDTLKKQIVAEIQGLLTRSTTIEEAEVAFLKMNNPAKQAKIIRTAVESIDKNISKGPSWLKKSWDRAKPGFKSPKAVWEWYKYGMAISAVYYIAINCGGKLVEEPISNIQKTVKACANNVLKSLAWLYAVPVDIYKATTSGESSIDSDTENVEGGNFTNDYTGCINWAATKGKRCEEDGRGGFVVYKADTPDDVTPATYQDGNWVEL
jgi:hypothetical protein